jgi:hypothetical protein
LTKAAGDDTPAVSELTTATWPAPAAAPALLAAPLAAAAAAAAAPAASGMAGTGVGGELPPAGNAVPDLVDLAALEAGFLPAS